MRRREAAKAKLTMRAKKLRIVPPSRPTTRAECVDGPRPCPWTKCRHHLGDLADRRAKARRADATPSTTCVLDYVDENPEGQTLIAVGRELGVSRERVRQISDDALAKLLARFGDDVGDLLEELDQRERGRAQPAKPTNIG